MSDFPQSEQRQITMGKIIDLAIYLHFKSLLCVLLRCEMHCKRHIKWMSHPEGVLHQIFGSWVQNARKKLDPMGSKVL